MGRRLILETNVVIAYERGTIDRTALHEDELSIAAATLAEYRVGIEMAATVERAATRSHWLDVVLAEVEILEYTRNTADHHARLLAHVRRTGAPRGTHDLIIAAHAAETGRTVISRDAKARFENLPGVLSVTATPDLANPHLSAARSASRTDCALIAALPAVISRARRTGLRLPVTQTCVVHLLRASFRYAARQHWDALAKALRPIYTAATEDAAMERLVEFEQAWDRRTARRPEGRDPTRAGAADHA